MRKKEGDAMVLYGGEESDDRKGGKWKDSARIKKKREKVRNLGMGELE